MFILNMKQRLLIFILVVLTPITGYSMSLKKCMFSEVEGIVMQGGKPLEGAVLKRKYEWAFNDSTKEDATKSDENGRFQLPAMYDKGGFTSLIASIFPHQPLIYQEIDIHYNGKSYDAYKLRKSNYKINSQFDGKKIELRCDLDNEPSHEGDVYGVCVFVDK
jgi:hypothetical protein